MKIRITKKERIRKRSEFSNLFKSSDTGRIKTEGLLLFFRKNDFDYNRVASVPKKGFGSAVSRNRAKRISREIYRQIKDDIKKSYDLLFLIYPGDFSFTDRKKNFLLAIKKANLLIK